MEILFLSVKYEKMLAILICFFITSPLWSQEQEKNKKQSNGLSVLPIAAGNSTYGMMLGGAFFYHLPLSEERHLKSQIATVISQRGQAFVAMQVKIRERRWLKGMRVSISNFFDSYYGESRKVRKSPPDQISVLETSSEGYLAFRHSKLLSTQFLWEQKRRIDGNELYLVSQKQTLHTKLFPNEITNVFGIATTYDDSIETPVSPVGQLHQFTWKIMPNNKFTTLESQKRFYQISIDSRYYLPLSTDLILASRIFYGRSIGTPTYLYRYRLGGDLLRGYRYSRFKGTRIYTLQEEVRFPIWGIVSGSAFLGVADISDKDFTTPFYSYGVGSKIGLPPDFIAKVRFDIGFSRESINFIMQADHAF